MHKRPPLPPSQSRRQLLQSLILGGVASALPSTTLGAQSNTIADAARGTAPVIHGPVVDLVVEQARVNFTGQSRIATTINGSLPAPTLKFHEGDEVTIRVTNRLQVQTSIHWHGIILPFQMDGVPSISFDGIPPGETFTYRFKLEQSGTYWYHSHSGFQEMTGMYGALIIEPKAGEAYEVERDYIVQLSDWTDEEPMRVFNKLKIQSDMYNFNQPTVGDFFADVANGGIGLAMDKRRMWNQMRMNPSDLADLSAHTLTFLMNGSPADANWTAIFKPGERVRLRIINASSNTLFDVRIPGLSMQVVQADGQNVKPISVDEFRFGPGETYDVIVEPKDDAYTIFAQSMDRSGYVRGTLAVRSNLEASVPDIDPIEQLSMTDMMGDMGAIAGMDHSAHAAPAVAAVDHSAHGAPVAAAVDHSAHAAPIAAVDHSAHAAPTTTADHSGHNMGVDPLALPSKTVRHASTEYGATVDARIDTPRTNLDDPGVGLRNNGRRVLTLADLRSLEPLDNSKIPSREIELHLTGNMERYSWSFDGLEFGDSTPVHMRKDELVRIILQNDTMMTHPMHLHGMWSDIENENGELLSRQHTILVHPAQRISFLATPRDVGQWAWHCHLMFHMDAGMFRKVIVS